MKKTTRVLFQIWILAKHNCWKHYAIHKLEQGRLRKRHKKQIQRRSTLSHSFSDKPPNFLLISSGYSYCNYRTFAFNLGTKINQSLVCSQMPCLGTLVKTISSINLETEGRKGTKTILNLQTLLLPWDWVLPVPVCSSDGLQVGWFLCFELVNISN